MDVFHWDVDVVEQVCIKFHRVTTRHEDHDFFFQVLPKESEQQAEFLLWFLNDHIALLQIFHGRT